MPVELVLTARFSSWKATMAPASRSPCVPVTLPLIKASCAVAGQGSTPSNAHNVARGPRSRIVGKDHSRARIHIPRTGIAGAILHHVRTACKGLSSAPRASSRSCPAPSEARSSAQRRRWQQHLQWADVELGVAHVVGRARWHKTGREWRQLLAEAAAGADRDRPHRTQTVPEPGAAAEPGWELVGEVDCRAPEAGLEPATR